MRVGQKVLCHWKFTPSDKYEVPECGKVYTVRDTDGHYMTFEEIRNSYCYNGKEIAFIDDWFRLAKKEIDFSDVTCPKSVWR
jgi:hypothetical protein